MIKVYISGQITGLDYDEVVKLFAQAEEYLISIGMEPVNPLKNGLPKNASWVNHMLRDIEMLMECDTIYLMKNWQDSRGARIERMIAKEMGHTILYEGRYDALQVERIKYAIEIATGFWFNDYTTKSRCRDLYYARMAFITRASQHCTVSEISQMINRPDSTVNRCLKVFQTERKFNKDFREVVDRIDSALGKLVSQ